MYWDDRKIHDAIWIEYYVQGTWTYHYPKFPEHKHIYLTSSYSFMIEQSYLNIPYSYYLPFRIYICDKIVPIIFSCDNE